jgi:thiosulfate/3-mercaptopyruvate sulfurtransferase
VLIGPVRLHPLFALLLSALIASACEQRDVAGSTAASREPVAYENIVAGNAYANPDVLVDTEWVLAHLADPGVRVIDVSSKPEVYDEGRLPGASYVQWNTQLVNPDNHVEGQLLSADALSELMSSLGVSNAHTVVFYDNTNNLFAARAYWVLKYYGHADVRIYNGGRKKWLADGNELTTEAAAVTAGDYLAGDPDPQIATDWEYVLKSIDDPSVRYCDARRPTEYAGEEMMSERGGRIPGAVNVEWSRTIQEDGTFLDAQALAELYQAAGFTPDQEIITYCQSGVRGAHTWFVLSELLGYPRVRNYDGSWVEYGNRADSPIQN